MPVVLLAVFAVLPLLSLDIPVLFGGPLDSPGTLGLLALCLTFAGVALTYDLLFGFTGLLSFGHALYFALGVYVTTIAAIAVPPIEPKPPITTTMNAKISSEVPRPGSTTP